MRKHTSSNWLIIFLCFLLLAVTISGLLIYNLIQWMMMTWEDLNVDEIIFHLKVPLEGTSQDLITQVVNYSLPSVILLLFFLVVIGLKIRKNIKMTVRFLGITAAISGVSAFSTFSLAADQYGLWEYLENKKMESRFIEANYIDPRNVSMYFPEQKRNLIYIYLESMETTYASSSEQGAFAENYISDLTSLAEQNINFSQNDRFGGGYVTLGSSWTMGGMFAQTSGVPLFLPVEKNSMDMQGSFFPALHTLGDILNQEGYNQLLCIGSESEFGGRRNYFEHHGNFFFWDYKSALETGSIPPDYRVFWGYEDRKLFEFAKDEALSLYNEGQPFNLTLLTVDTHFEDGYACELCNTEFGDDQYANVMACSARQVREFVEWLKEQEFYENTTVIISGDHLTMDKDFCANIPKEYERRVYNTIINSPVEPVAEKNRIFTTLDMFPTTLASLGVEIEGDRLALGTNLFSEEETLAEREGIDIIESEFSKESTFFDQFTKDIIVTEDNKDSNSKSVYQH